MPLKLLLKLERIEFKHLNLFKNRREEVTRDSKTFFSFEEKTLIKSLHIPSDIEKSIMLNKTTITKRQKLEYQITNQESR